MENLINAILSNDYGPARRQGYFAHHQQLEKKGLDCSHCAGTCCTFEANSMRITPLEALEIVFFLEENGHDLSLALQDCRKAIEQYRLDQPLILNRSGLSFRRTYTCPFFKNGQYGCKVSRDWRPFGCLAFNPNEQGQRSGGNCSHHKDAQIMTGNESGKENLSLGRELGWFEDSLPLPLAVESVLVKKLS